MLKVKVYNTEGQSVGEQELLAKVFAVKPNHALIHQAVVTQQANERQVLAHTKDRSEVRGGGKKPWRQKGTGRARVGSSRSPIWIGGGVTFGPTKDRNFSKKLNKKMKQQALFMALTDKLESENLAVVDKLEIAEYKTKAINGILKNLESKVLKIKPDKKIKRSLLVILGKKDEKTFISGRNLAGAEIINLDNINIVEVLRYKSLIMTVDGIKKLEKTYSK
jgi:large subunit ribosomal protein L4